MDGFSMVEWRAFRLTVYWSPHMVVAKLKHQQMAVFDPGQLKLRMLFPFDICPLAESPSEMIISSFTKTSGIPIDQPLSNTSQVIVKT